MTPERRRLLRHRHLSGGLEVEDDTVLCVLCDRRLDRDEAIHAEGNYYCNDCYPESYPLCDFCLTETFYEYLVTVGVYKVCAACAERDDEPCEQPRVTDRED